MINDPVATLRELRTVLATYADHLAEVLPKIRPTEATAAREFFASVPNPDNLVQVWGWARVLAGWAHWRPACLDCRLSIPKAEDLARVAAACRAAVETTEVSSRRWLQLSKTAYDPKDALLAAAELLDAVRIPNPLVPRLMVDLVPIGKTIDRVIDLLPPTWVPTRLVDLVTRLKVAVNTAPHSIPLQPGPWTETLTGVGFANEENNATARLWWSGWFSAEGAEWFHELAALAQTNREAAQWLWAICTVIGVKCFPHVNSETGALTWPPEVTVFQPGLKISPGIPLGSIGPVERFATLPEKARFTLLLGHDPASPFGTAVAAWQEAIGPELAPVRAKLATAIEQTMRSGETPTAVNILAVLDELTHVEPNIRPIQPTLMAVRVWASTGGWSVIPETLPETAEGLTMKAVFKRDVAAGNVLRLKAFGLIGPEGMVRPGEVVVSAGPPPHGLTELEAAAAGVPGDQCEELRSAIRGLRVAGLGGYLELAVVDLYVMFWDRVQPLWVVGDPVVAEAFASALLAMLQETFGLYSFSPTNYRDYPPDWVIVPPGTRMTTGRVTRVLRPGLKANGVLRLPAKVEAD